MEWSKTTQAVAAGFLALAGTVHAQTPAPVSPTAALSGLSGARQANMPRVFAPTMPRISYSTYPWKTEISATVFWIGEEPTANNPTPNNKSSWDVNWTQSYGGFDTPDATKRTVNYTPANFIPKQNPFYIALPYNDLIDSSTTKSEARSRIPWFSKRYVRAGKSVLEGQWIAIRYGNRVCYAQWEDCGPFVTDDVEYVFGNAKPKNTQNNAAGIDVSPAVRDYLGLSTNTKVDWRFVDFNEIPDGPWRTYGTNNPFVRALATKANSEKAVLASRLEELRRMRDDYFRQSNGSGQFQNR